MHKLRAQFATFGLLMNVLWVVPAFSKSLNGEARLTYVRIPTNQADTKILSKHGFAQDHFMTPDYVYGYVPAEHLAEIEAALGLSKIEYPEAWTLQKPHSKSALIKESPMEILARVRRGYLDHEALTRKMSDIVTVYPEIASIEVAGKSAKGKDIPYLKLSDPHVDQSKKVNVLFIANMHGNETAGRSVLLRFAQLYADMLLTEANQNYSHIDLWVVPTMNPDGFEQGSRGNANFVDLNRNFPDFVRGRGQIYERLQPEIRAIVDLHKKTTFAFALNFHGGNVCFNMPWDSLPNQEADSMFPDATFMQHLARNYADLNQTMFESGFDRGVTFGYEWYPVYGGMQDWANHYQGSLHATIELSHNKWPNANDLPQIWEENRDSLLAFANSAGHGYFLKLVEKDSDKQVKSDKILFSYSNSKVESEHSEGKVLRPSYPGISQVKIDAKGYDTIILELSTKDIHAGFQVIELVKS